MTDFRPPRYGTATVADLTTSVLGALDVPSHRDVLGLPAARGYVVLVIDGLGWRQLHAHADDAPFLASVGGRALDSVHPSTTAANLASIGTGRPPGEHGLVGYTVALPGDARPFNLLTWAAGPHMQGESLLDEVQPELYQATRTVWEAARQAGVAVTTVVRDSFQGTGLTRAVLRGGDTATAEDLPDSLVAALTAAQGEGRSLAYAHHGRLDTIGHRHGPGSPEWRVELRRIDQTLAHLSQRIPDDVRVLVTADHGMVHVPPNAITDVTDESGLVAGVRVVAGEARARQLHCQPGREQEVFDRWSERLDAGFRILTRTTAIAEGWFGPKVLDSVEDRIGDILVWSLDTHGAIVNGAMDPGRGRMRGMHGSVTRDEVEVPLIALPGK